MSFAPLRHSPRDACYLGDGVYGSHDGYCIWLTARVDGHTHEIALEPEVLRALDSYRKALRERAQRKTATPEPQPEGS